MMQPNEIQVVAPQPAPETWVPELLPDGTIVLTIYGVFGTHKSFMTPDVALGIARSIETVARQHGGLVVPPKGFTVPPPSTNGHHEH